LVSNVELDQGLTAKPVPPALSIRSVGKRMNKLSPQRRQLLLYFGLGIVGAGAATAFGISSRKDNLSATDADDSPTAKAPSAANSAETAPLTSSGKALPEFQGISQWLNSAPLSIANLKGSVVLVQFWTFACINCQRTLPDVVRWHQQYAAHGLKVIGIHTPEFAYEREVNNIQRALQQHKITYPVPVDNDYKTWNAYSNQYWPHLFLADRQGVLRYDHIGEGAYDITEQTIRKLLG
jgi:thiol-disulfide isomerase/thioredoxin